MLPRAGSSGKQGGQHALGHAPALSSGSLFVTLPPWVGVHLLVTGHAAAAALSAFMHVFVVLGHAQLSACRKRLNGLCALRLARTASRVQQSPAAAAAEARTAVPGLGQACHGPAPDWKLLPGAPTADVRGGARLTLADWRRFPNAEAAALHNCAPLGGTLWGDQPWQGSHGGAQGPVQNEPEGLLVAGPNGPGHGSLCDGPETRHSLEPMGPPLGCLARARLVAGPTGRTSVPGLLSGRYDPLGRPLGDPEGGAVPAWPGFASGSGKGLWAGAPFSPETPAGGACGTSVRTAQVATGSDAPGLPATGAAGSPTAQPHGHIHAADPEADPAGFLPPAGALGAAAWPPLDLDWVGLLAMDPAPVECSTAGGASESATYGTLQVKFRFKTSSACTST